MISPETHCGIDSMSNIACISPQVAQYLQFKTEIPTREMRFGSYSHDGTMSITQIAKDNRSKYLPRFAVTMTGKMAILPSSWLSQMGYEYNVHPYERGFSIVNSHTQEIVYEGEQHSDQFHYVSWVFLRSLKPATTAQVNYQAQVEVDNQMPYLDYIDAVAYQLDLLNDNSSKCGLFLSNATRKQRNEIPMYMVRAIREEHTRTGHQNPRQMAETIAQQARSDMPEFTDKQVLTVMSRWPCLFCKGTAQKRGSTNTGSGVKPAEVGAQWSMDTKMGYAEAYHFGFDAIHIFIDIASGKTFHRGFKAPDNANEVNLSIRALVIECNSRRKRVTTLIVDAGKINISASVREYCADKNILIEQVPPKEQYLNPVERLIEVWQDKTNAIIATARLGSTLTEKVWYSAAVISLLSLDTQIRPTFSATMTPYEAFTGTAPNLSEIFKFRLGQIVTVTTIIAHAKTDHSLAGVACFTLHPDAYTRRFSGTWVYCPSNEQGYLRSNRDIQPCEFSKVPNQSIQYFQPTHNSHPTYPAKAILKLIDDNISAQMEIEQQEPKAEHDLQVDPYINCNVRKKFGRKFYKGKVDYAWFNKDKTVHYHVIYEDGEEHDYTEAELKDIVIAEPQSSINTVEMHATPEDHELNDDTLHDYYTVNYTHQLSFFIPDDYEQCCEEDDSDPTLVSTYEVNSTIIVAQDKSKEMPIHKAFREDRQKWEPITSQLMHTHLHDLQSIALVNINDIPYDAKIFPSTILCKEGKVDTSKVGEHRKNDARLVVQDSRSVHSPAEVYSSVASSKAIKLVLGVAAHNGMKPQIRDIVKAFPNTPLPQELKGKLYIRLPKELGYSSDTFAMLINAVEGFKLSNHIYDRYIHDGFKAHGFQTVPNDDQLIFKVQDDGNFIWAVKVVDNVLSISTQPQLDSQLVTAMEQSGYTVKDEAPDKFIGMQLEWNADGDLLLHQERYEGKLITKHGITTTAPTPLPSNFSHTNYRISGESEPIDITSYQRLLGEILYLNMTNTAVPYANSAIAQKTQYCTQRDFDAGIHILRYINGHRKQGLIFRRAPEGQRPLRLADILDMPLPIYFSCDGAHNAMTELVNPQDQAGYYIKLYSWYTAAVECVSKTQRITLSSTEAEVASMVLALRSALDIYFILNAIGFTNICRIIAHGDSASGNALCTEQSGVQKRSKHFNKNAAWVRNFVDGNVLGIYHTSTDQLTSNALTKRVTEAEQQWSTDDIRGQHHHEVPTTNVTPVPIRRSDHAELWPVIPCSSFNI